MKKIAVLLFLIVCGSCFSQKTIQNQRIWFSYLGQYKVSSKWGIHLEAQFRLDNELEQSLQKVVRVGGIYYLSPRENLTGGYAYLSTLSSSLNKFYLENRLWEQYQFNKKWSRNTMTHRLRLEQRWVEQLSSNSTAYQNRFRYLNRNLFHLANLKSDTNEIYAILQDEFFITLGENMINSKFIDQNRFLVGLGLNYRNAIRLELGYMNQFVTSSYGNDAMNHIISVSVFHNLDLQKH